MPLHHHALYSNDLLIIFGHGCSATYIYFTIILKKVFVKYFDKI